MLCLSTRLQNWMVALVFITWLGGLIYTILLYLADTDYTKPEVTWIHNIHNKQTELRSSEAVLSMRNLDPLMIQLGFIENPRLYPQAYQDYHLPVFLTAVSKDHLTSFPGFISSYRLYFPDMRLVVYNLNVPDHVIQKFFSVCRCQIRNVLWHMYPSHVEHNLNWRSYRPLLIQEALQEFGAVFWADPETRFTSGYLDAVKSQALRVGVVSWPMTHATSAMTHYGVFEYFNASQSDYYFHRMVNSAQLLLYNTETVHKELMYAWIRCTLDCSCVAPLGSQPGGCHLSRRPLYTYSGCHHYDLSVLNVVLGQVYQYKTPYIAVEDFFEVVLPKKSYWIF